MNLLQPVKGELNYDGCISQKFNDPYISADLLALYNSMGLNAHNGIDFYKGRGEPIYAAHDGVVVYAQEFASITGKGIKLWNKEGCYSTLYAHNDELLVSQGQSVSRGQIIARMGNSGSQYFYMGVHLHFGLYLCDSQGITINLDNGFKGAVDPLPFMLNNMEYIIIGKEQYLLYAPLKMALNIGDQNILAGLTLNGLTGAPQVKTSLPVGYKVYPLVDKETIRDIFGL